MCIRDREKNPQTLLQAFSIIQNTVDSVLVFVGDGPLKADLLNLARELGVAHRTIFAGKVPPAVMPHLYAGSDLFMFTSLTDTQGLVIAEAKSAGVPCVAVGALGVTDMVENGVDGFLCNNNPHDIAHKALLLLQNPDLLGKMKRNAMSNARKVSIEHSCEKLLDCYSEIYQTWEIAQ